MSPQLPVVGFDDRSLNTVRMTGWERYCKSLFAALGSNYDLRVPNASGLTLRERFVTDWRDLPRFSHGPDLMHFPTFPPTPLVRGRVVYTVHDLTWWRYPQYSTWMGRTYYRRLAESAIRRSHIITVSNAIADELHQEFKVPRDDISVTPLGSSLEPSVSPHRGAKAYLLAVGTIEPRKNLNRLVEAYRLSGLASTHDLIIVGRLGWSAAPAGVDVRTGVDDRALSALYTGAHAVVAPSLYEGFGLPVLEGLACGASVVCSDIPAFREVAGSAANYFDPLDVEGMAAALHAAPSRAQVEKASLARASLFSWENTAARTVEAYVRAAER